MPTPGPSRIHVVKDTVSWVGGLLGIAYQTITGDVNPILTGVFMGMLGLPGILGIYSAVRNTTPPQSSSPPQDSSQQPSASQES